MLRYEYECHNDTVRYTEVTYYILFVRCCTSSSSTTFTAFHTVCFRLLMTLQEEQNFFHFFDYISLCILFSNRPENVQHDIYSIVLTEIPSLITAPLFYFNKHKTIRFIRLTIIGHVLTVSVCKSDNKR